MLATLVLIGQLAATLPNSPQTPSHPPTPQRIEGRASGFVQGTLNLGFGERATLRRRPDGAYDLIAVDRIGITDVLPPQEGSTASINGAAPDTIRFGLMGQGGVGTLLKVENGQDAGLKYSGHILRYVGGQIREPVETSVCTVPPGLVSFERWPEPVFQIVIGALQRSDDTVPTCPPHIPEPSSRATEAPSTR